MCELPASITGDMVTLYQSSGFSCAPGYAMLSYVLIQNIKQDICDNADFEQWAIANGADCNLRGNGYNCLLAEEQDSGAGEAICVKCVGPDPPPTNGPVSGGGLGGGAIFLIILVSVLFMYIVGGIIYNKFVKKEGVSHPHLETLKGIPGLVKDGCMFTISKIKRGGSSEKYEEL